MIGALTAGVGTMDNTTGAPRPHASLTIWAGLNAAGYKVRIHSSGMLGTLSDSPLSLAPRLRMNGAACLAHSAAAG